MRWLKQTRGVAVIVVVVAMMIGAAPMAVADEPPAPRVCDPVTLDSLFPAEDETAPIDETIGDEAPAETPGESEVAPVDPAPADPASGEPAAGEPAADEPAIEEPPCIPFVYGMLSPVAGRAQVISGFAQPRPGDRLHKGADVAGPKLTPVYAVSAGVVIWTGPECCSLAIQHPDGWTSYYIHLNNDSYGTDDGLGYGIAPGITVGSEVAEGQFIGWIGDSGNAEETVPHVHFELRMPDGRAIDVVPSLGAARLPAFSDDFNADARPPFGDDDGHPLETLFGTLASLGLLDGCGSPQSTNICPDKALTGAGATDLIASVTDIDLDPASILTYNKVPTDPWASIGPDLARCGVYWYCDDQVLTALETAQLVGAAYNTLMERAAAAALEAAALEAAPAVADEPTPGDISEPDAGSTGEEQAVLAPLVYFQCATDTDWLAADGSTTTADLVGALSEMIGILRVAPCGQLD